MAEASALTPNPSTRQLASRAADRQVDPLIQAVKAAFTHKPAQHLSEILGCDISTAERYFAGARAPSFDNVKPMLRHPVTSVAMLEEATRHLSTPDYEEFWREMAKAALRAFVRENRSEPRP